MNLTVHEKLDMRLANVFMMYLYGSLDHSIFIIIPKEFKVPEVDHDSRETYLIKLQKFLYTLKQMDVIQSP